MINGIGQIIGDVFQCPASELKQIENITNNNVFAFKCNEKEYIFKVFRSKYWPEDGKLQFVNQLLLNNEIPCAEFIEFTRTHPQFPNGYLIEQKVDGITADKIQFTKECEIEFYQKLAVLVSKVHQIPVKGFGYMGSGEGGYGSMHAFFDDEFDERTQPLIEKGIFDEMKVQHLKRILVDTLKAFDDLPSVLCHGDLSKKNVIVRENGQLILIDWDDTMAYHWMADIARFTFWMKMSYDAQDYLIFRNAFLDHYQGLRKAEFDIFEKAFHIYVSFDVLSFAINVGNLDMQQFAMAYIASLYNDYFAAN